METLTQYFSKKNSFLIFFLMICVCLTNAYARDSRTLDMASLISSASKSLGLDMADDVANLVSAAFGQPPSRRGGGDGDPLDSHSGNEDDSRPGAGAGVGSTLFTGLLKLVGLDPNKLGALALNAVIFVAQMVSNSLIGRPPAPQLIRTPQTRYPTAPMGYPGYASILMPGTVPGQFRQRAGEGASPKADFDNDEAEPEGTPVSWILNNPMIKETNLMRTAQDPTLSEKLEQVVKSRTARSVDGSEEMSTPCIQQLVCRSAPFVWAMQRSLNDLLNPSQKSSTAASWSSLTPVQRMYAYLPASSEIEDRAKLCREKLPACRATVL